MKYYKVGKVLLVLTLLHTTLLYAVDEAPTSPNPFFALPQKADAASPTYAVSFTNIIITDYIRGFVSKVADKNFVFNEDELNFTISFVSPQGTSVDNIMASLAQILRIRGFSMVEQGNNIIIYKGEKGADAPVSSELITDDQTNLPSLSEVSIVTQVFRLTHLKPETLDKIVKPMLSPNAVIAFSPETRHLIVTDFNANLKKIQALINDIDSAQSTNDQITIYKSRGTDIEQLVSMANKVIIPGPGERKPRFELDAKNKTIFILGSPGVSQKAVKIFETIDIATIPTNGLNGTNLTFGTNLAPTEPPPENHSGFLVYKLQYHKGDKIKEALVGMGNALNIAGMISQDVVNTITSAQWVESTNALMFAGNSDAIAQVKKLLKESDMAPKQVFIEVLVIQTSLSNTFEFGVEWGLAGPKTGLGFGSSGMTANAMGFSPAPTQAPAVTPPPGASFMTQTTAGKSDGGSPQNNFQAGVVGNIIRHKGNVYTSLAAMVKALQTDGKVQILINPKLITQDNVPAQLEVAEDRQVDAGSTTNVSSANAPTQVSVEKTVVKVGNILKITPIIDNDNMVTLEIDFEVSSLNDKGKNYTKTMTHTRTRVHVPNNNFLVLSGQIRDEQRHSNQKIPCLGSMSGIGSLFGSKDRSSEKTSIMIFIRPRVVSDNEEIEEETLKQRRLIGKNSYTKEFPNTLDATLQFLQIDPKEIPTDD